MPVTIEEVACSGCGACVNSCPTDVLRINTAKGKAYAAHLEDCQECFLCELDCPVDAIFVTTRQLAAETLLELVARLKEDVRFVAG